MLRTQIKAIGMTAALCTTLGLVACKTPGDVWHYEAADRLSAPAEMNKRQITASPYMITVFEKVHQQGGTATIYIAGDGTRMGETRAPETAGTTRPSRTSPQAEEDRTASMPLGNSSPSTASQGSHISSPGMAAMPVDMNPTPVYPLALHLASRDLSSNVVFMARPCQYSGMAGTAPGTMCDKDVWTKGRYSIENMNAMNTALDKLAARYGFTGFNLVGFDGGAAVAVLLAAKRKDVLSLRTVGGILDTDRYNADHHLPPMSGSLNPKDFAKDIATIPQHHFLGEWDKDVTPDVYQSFRDAMGPGACIRYSLVAKVDHENGWANRWDSLLKQPLDCSADQE